MALFGKKDDGADAGRDNAHEKRNNRGRGGRGNNRGGGGRRGNERKRSERLSSVFKETVVESALGDLERIGAKFSVSRPDTGDVYFVTWLLDTKDIGGLSKRMARDEDRGSIIECVNANRMKVIINDKMMEADAMAFIMDDETIDAMSEFTLLTNAPYQTLYINRDGSVITTDGTVAVSFQDAEAVASGKVMMDDMLEQRGCSWFAGSVTAPVGVGATDPDMTVNMPPVGVSPEGYVDDVDEVEDYPGSGGFSDASLSDIDAVLGGGQPPQEPQQGMYDPYAQQVPQQPSYDPYAAQQMPQQQGWVGQGTAMNEQQVYQEDMARQANASSFSREQAMYNGDLVPGVEPPQEVARPETVTTTADEMTTSIVSRYFTQDLGLIVTDDPFVVQFGEGNPLSTFDENRGEGFMNEYLSEFSRAANEDMRNLRDSNLYRLREHYMVLVSKLVATISASMSFDSPDTDYGRAKRELQDEYHRKLRDADQRVEAMRKSIEDDFDRAVKEAGEAAAATAREEYRTQHESAFKQSIMDVEGRVHANIESEYQSELNKLSEMRRAEAAKEFDRGIAGILSMLVYESRDMYVDEYHLYTHYRTEMSVWIDNNRKEDLAYAETLREEQLRSERADAVRAEYEAELERRGADFKAQRQRLEDELNHLSQRNNEYLEDLERRHSDELVTLRSKNDELQAQFNDLLDRYSSLDATKKAEYDMRLQQAKDDAEMERKRAEQAGEQNKVTYRMVIVVFVVTVIAALAVGVVIGMFGLSGQLAGIAMGVNAQVPAALTAALPPSVPLVP